MTGSGSLPKVWADPRRARESRASEEAPVSFHPLQPFTGRHSGSAAQAPAPTHPQVGLRRRQTLRHDTNNGYYQHQTFSEIKRIFRINLKYKFESVWLLVMLVPCVVCIMFGEASGTWHAATQPGPRGAIPPPAPASPGQLWPGLVIPKI